MDKVLCTVVCLAWFPLKGQIICVWTNWTDESTSIIISLMQQIMILKGRQKWKTQMSHLMAPSLDVETTTTRNDSLLYSWIRELFNIFAARTLSCKVNIQTVCLTG